MGNVKMTEEEITLLLNSMLPVTQKQKRALSANNKLNEVQKMMLYDDVKELCSKECLIKKVEKIDKCIEDVVGILKSIGYNQNIKYAVRKNCDGEIIRSKNGEETHVPHGYSHMPFLIKQVIFLICVRAKQSSGKFTQKDILDEFCTNGIKIGHNGLSDLFDVVTPNEFVKTISYRQPENPVNYMGGKNNKLGVAIKHLVRFAECDESYDIYVDVFGGSSSATVAPRALKNKKYIYNDIDTWMINYVKVMMNKKSSVMLAKKMSALQELIKNGEKGDGNFIEYFFDLFIEEYYQNRESKPNPNTKKQLDNILISGVTDEMFSYNDIKDFFIRFHKFITPKIQNSDLQEFINPDTDTTKTYTISDIRKLDGILDFCRHYKVIRFLIKKYAGRDVISDLFFGTEAIPIQGDTNKDLVYVEAKFQQYRAMAILGAINVLYKNQRNIPECEEGKVSAAIVVLFRNFMKVSVEEGSDSAIRRYLPDPSRTEIDTKILDFIEKDYKECIFKYHQELKRLNDESNVTNKDCIDLIKAYSDKNALFYVDSPYIDTEAYHDGKRWEFDDMKKLIDALFQSNNKFIFSMRACKDLPKGSNESPVDVNRQIISVLKHFECWSRKKNLPLYVVAPDYDMDKLAERLQNNNKCEIMITNYPIYTFCDFTDEVKKGTIFKVLSFENFFEITKNNIVKE